MTYSLIPLWLRRPHRVAGPPPPFARGQSATSRRALPRTKRHLEWSASVVCVFRSLRRRLYPRLVDSSWVLSVSLTLSLSRCHCLLLAPTTPASLVGSTTLLRRTIPRGMVLCLATILNGSFSGFVLIGSVLLNQCDPGIMGTHPFPPASLRCHATAEAGISV
jgi:hypothetical protein